MIAGMCRYLLLITLLFCQSLSAAERILSFHSEIAIDADSSMLVEETIRVFAEGRKIRRGIYREFPTTYRDDFGNRFTVGLEVLEVTRDGEPEPWHTERRANGVRIYAGDKGTMLTPGNYTYRFTYRTNRQLGFFRDHDELYWNVTGTGWEFPIERASAQVTLPTRVSASALRMSGYTGKQGATGQEYDSQVGEGAAHIAATRPLGAREGLTLVMQWPKGVVREPTLRERVGYVIDDNPGVSLALVAFAASLGWLLLVWWRNGRDPEAGVVFPHYEPPQGYSPASARYINRMGYDNRTFTAAVINLAVKGHLSISRETDDYILQRESCSAVLAPGEKAMINRLFNRGAVLVLENSNHRQVEGARKAHRRALARDYLNRYFVTNAKLMWPSALLSVLLLAVIIIQQVFVPVVYGVYFAIIALHALFGWLLKAPLARGRALMDKLQGFALYLEVAEKEDLDLRNPPDRTPELFEAYLPFAIALEVEQAWSEQFSAVFARLRAEEGRDYRPNWYRGNFNYTQMGDFSRDVGGGLSTAIASASRAPGSSSGGGGGGFSGGGGGGGGGGGW